MTLIIRTSHLDVWLMITGTMSLPVEVLDYILSFLQSEVAILQACTQSHPILSKLVEQYLYANIILHDENRYPNNNFHGLQIVEFINLVSDSPHISNYVQNLAICVRFHGKQRRLLDMAQVLVILPRFSVLKTLTLCTIGNKICPWVMLHRAFRSAFLDFLNQGPPKEVSIGCLFSISLSLLDDCERIKRLNTQRMLRCVFWGSSEPTRIHHTWIFVYQGSQICVPRKYYHLGKSASCPGAVSDLPLSSDSSWRDELPSLTFVCLLKFPHDFES